MARQDSFDRSQPKLYPLFNVGRSIPDRERRKGSSERGEKEFLQRNKSDQRTNPMAWHIYNLSKGMKVGRNLMIRRRPALLLEVIHSLIFFLYKKVDSEALLLHPEN